MENVGRMNRTVMEDVQHIYNGLTEEERGRFRDSRILITGAGGFLGFYILQFLSKYKAELGIQDIICLDTFYRGKPGWISKLEEEGCIRVYGFDIAKDDVAGIEGAENADYIIHMASIASPLYYRQYPIETLDANVWGLRRLLDFYREKPIRGFEFFSTSEIYGDPSPEWIPTPESYRGFVDCQGPRACYDESKRFGETICYLYEQKYHIPISIIRLFNVYGPGMRLNDARVAPDFANAVRENRDIVLYSDGTPTRSFCYVSEAVNGLLKVLLHAQDGFDTFNIGMDRPEISVRRFAEIFAEKGRKVSGYTGEIRMAVHEDTQYLKNNPGRRCPSIEKAKEKLGYAPAIEVEEGVERFIRYMTESTEEELIW